MEGQIIILTTLNPIKEVVKITSSFSTHKHENHLPVYLSPLMTIADLKSYIESELASMVSITNIDELIIWSPSVNIEMNHPHKIYTPDKQISEFHRSDYIIDYNIFETGPIYISGNIKLIGKYNYAETFFTRLYREANLSVPNIQINYINIFRSNIAVSDYYLLKKILPSGVLCTLFVKLNDQLLMTGDVVPLVIPADTFVIQLHRLVSNNLVELVNINEKKITVSDTEFFEQLLLEFMRHKPSYVVPERYYNTVNYSITSEKSLSTKYGNYENIFLFFQNYEGWDSDNIIQSKHKEITLFLAVNGIKIRSVTPQVFLAQHATRIILGYAAINEVEDANIKFDKIKGIYWSRLCQNNNNNIRKPVKIHSEDYSSTKSQIAIDGEIYKCLDNAERKFIGFLTKPYELSRICLPCCYLTDQTNKKLFKKCTTVNQVSSVAENIYSLFIIDSGRFLGTNRLAFLEDVADEYLNSGKALKMSNKLLEECKDYYLVTGNNYTELPNVDVNYIIDELIKTPQVVIIHNNTFYVSMYYDYSKQVTLKVMHKNFLYIVGCVTKTKDSDSLVIKTLYDSQEFLKKSKNIVTKLSDNVITQRVDNIVSLGDIKTTSYGVIVRSGLESTISMSMELNEKFNKKNS